MIYRSWLICAAKWQAGSVRLKNHEPNSEWSLAKAKTGLYTSFLNRHPLPHLLWSFGASRLKQNQGLLLQETIQHFNCEWIIALRSCYRHQALRDPRVFVTTIRFLVYLWPLWDFLADRRVISGFSLRFCVDSMPSTPIIELKLNGKLSKSQRVNLALSRFRCELGSGKSNCLY